MEQKGFTVICNVCGSVAVLIKNNQQDTTPIDIWSNPSYTYIVECQTCKNEVAEES